MSASPLLRTGDRGAAVSDVQQRLVASGIVTHVDGEYGADTERAVRQFQTARGLRVDGICGPETWSALVESGFALGDRLLYLRHPMLRGDDVATLQRRLNSLGFHAGREDGIFGPETEAAVAAFQRDVGLAVDRVCGPATLAVLDQVGSLAAGSVATVRERDVLRREPRRLREARVFVAGDLGLTALTSTVARGLRDCGAIVAVDTSGEDAGVVAATANRFEAAVFVALTVGADPHPRCAYFESNNFRSEGGFCLAARLTDALRKVFTDVGEPVGRTYRLLRDTRMAAVACELVPRDDADAVAALSARLPAIAEAIVEGVRRGVEEPV